MNDASRTQGGLICVGVVVVGALFLLGLLQKSYWALAIPVAAIVLFVLGLTFGVGYTIATIQVESLDANEPARRDVDSDELRRVVGTLENVTRLAAGGRACIEHSLAAARREHVDRELRRGVLHRDEAGRESRHCAHPPP